MSATVTTLELDTVPHATTPVILPFRIDVPEAILVDLRQRLAATRWPAKETVSARSQRGHFAAWEQPWLFRTRSGR